MKILKIIIFVLLLGSILTVLLIGVDKYTAPIIKKNDELKTKRSVLNALDIAYNERDLEKTFSDNIKVVERKDRVCYESRQKEVAFEVSGSGVWGPIRGVIALKPDLERIKGITIIYQEETPGLGSIIAEKEYLDKFIDKKVSPYLKIVTGGKAKGDNEVDAISGATMTSRAFEELLNKEIKSYLLAIKGK